MIAHGGGHPGGLDPLTAAALAGLAIVVAAYFVLALRQRHDPREWSNRRTVAFAAGSLLLGVGLVPGIVPPGSDDFRQHMLQHLLIGMFAPLGLVLGAPITLVLRSVRVRTAGRIGRVLRSAPMRVVADTYVLLALNIGGLVALYFSPLYVATTGNSLLHGLVHLHFFLAGYGFAWIIAGPDPAPHRLSVPRRLVVLGVAIFAHAAIAQLLYADLWVRVPATAGELRGAGDLMYFGGDIGELLLALALVSTWRPVRSVNALPVPSTSS